MALIAANVGLIDIKADLAAAAGLLATLDDLVDPVQLERHRAQFGALRRLTRADSIARLFQD